MKNVEITEEIDDYKIRLVIRDINGKRYVMLFKDRHSFLQTNFSIYDEYEILMVKINDELIYSSLTDQMITFDELTGFFA